MIELLALGSLELTDAETGPIERVLAQPKRAALLVYLALARPRGFHRRDELVDLFWPENDVASARNSLSRGLSILRHWLPDGLVVTRGVEEVGLDLTAVSSDVIRFEDALERGEPATALDLYRGPFLNAFHVPDAPEFERWVDTERERLRELASGAAWAAAHARIRAGRFVDAERLGQRALGLSPTDESAVRAFIEALGDGDRAAALNFYDRFAAVLAEELEVEPSWETAEVAARIRIRGGVRDPAVGGSIPPGPAAPGPPAGSILVGTPPGSGPSDEGVSRGPFPARGRRAWGRWWAPAAAGAIAVAWLGLRSSGVPGMPGRPPTPVAGPDLRTVAVLPFELEGTTRTDTALARGLGLEVLRLLSGVPSLRVLDGSALGGLGSTDVRMYRRRLGVDAVLLGRIDCDADRVRANARIVDAATGIVVWSGALERERSTQPALPGDLVAAALGHLGIFPTDSDLQRLRRPPTTDTAAYRAYLEARHHFATLGPGGLARAAVALEAATDRDSTFAQAFAWRAWVRYFQLQLDNLRGTDHWPFIVRMADRALALDSTTAFAHTMLANARVHWDWDWAAAEPIFRRALALDPNDLETRVSYSQYLAFVGRPDEAVSEARKALDLAPVNAHVHAVLAFHLVISGRYEEAEDELARARDLNPESWVVPWAAGTLELARGRADAAVPFFARAVERVGSPEPVPDLAFALAEAGRPDSAAAVWRRFEEAARTRYVRPTLRMRLHLARGETQEALRLLETAWRDRDVTLAWDVALAPYTPALQPIGDAEMEAFAERLGVGRWYRLNRSLHDRMAATAPAGGP